MRMNTKLAFACVSLISMCHPAMAQQSPADEASDAESDDIIVQARRRDETVQDVPLVVNVVTAKSLENLNVRDGTEIQSLVPGLQLRNEANGIGASGQVRGVQFDINASAAPTVAFYLNDAYIDAGSVLQSIYDIGQVEVLRGPQGTLRGQSSPSGSITFTTKKPVLDEVGVVAQGTVSSTGTYNFNGAFNIPVIKDVLGVRIAGLYEENEANRVRSIDSDRNLKKPFADTQSIRVSALFTPTDWLRLEGMYQVIDRESQFYSQYASFNLVDPTAPVSPVLIRPRDRQSIQETASITDQKFEVLNWRGEFRFAGQKLIYQGSKSDLKFFSKGNQDAANFFNNRDFFQTTNTRSTLKTHEVRLQNEERLFGLLDYVLGYYSTDQLSPTDLSIETLVVLPFGLGTISNLTPVSTSGNTKEKAFFGNVTLHLGDKTQISGGLRQLDIETPARFIKIGANSLPTGPAVNDEKVIYTASIQHKFTPDLMVYASTGTSRRPGPSIVNPGIIISSPRINSYLALRSEDSTSYEVGFKSSWLDDRLIFNLTGYHQKFKNYPYKISTSVFHQGFNFVNNVPVPTVTSGAQFGASVPVTVKGVEAELSYKFSDNFNIGTLVSYADGKIKNGLIPCNDLNSDGVPDVTTSAPTLAQVQAAYGANFIGQCGVTQRSSVQSPFSAVVQAEYTRPVSGNVNMFARSLFSYNGSSQVEPTNRFDNLKSYGLLNLFLGARDKDGAWELTFYGKNVANTVKATRFDPTATSSFTQLNSSFQPSGNAPATSTYSQINTTAPREFGINLRFALGSK